MLNDNPKPPEVLATWNYQPDLWRDFLQYESGIYKGSVRAAKHLFFGSLILTFVFFLIVFLTLLFPNNWVSDFFELAIALVICGWFFIVFTGILWLYRRNRWNRINQRTGEVIITLNGVKTNGVSFDWDYKPFGLRFNKVGRKKSLYISARKSFEILEFHTVNYTHIEGRPIQENFECRVPIPFGKEEEAEEVMNRLRARLQSANDEWIKENFALGHEFSKGICQKCGDTIAEIATFSVKCRNKSR